MKRPIFSLFFLVVLTSGCSVKQMAMEAVADALSGGTGGSFSNDEDIQFVGDAIPFALKLMESVADSVPEHSGIRTTLAASFTQYGVVYVEFPATELKYQDYQAYEQGLARARGFYLRANRYAQQAFEINHPGFRERIFNDTEALLNEMTAEDVPLLYWTAASWLSALSTTFEDPELIGIFPIASAMMKRAEALDGDWDNGAIHEALIALEPNLPEPGGKERSRAHFEHLLELQHGLKAGPYVSLATAIPLKAQDKDAFVDLLNKALAVDPFEDPDSKLANLYAQAKARFLLEHLDELFF